MSQTVILRKMSDFLDLRLKKLQQHSPPDLALIGLMIFVRDRMRKIGYCQGFAIAYGVMCYLGKKEWWEQVLQAIETWDGQESSLSSELTIPGADPKLLTTKLETLFERTIDYITSAQANLDERPDINPANQYNFTKPGNRFETSRLEITHEEEKKTSQPITVAEYRGVGGNLSKARFIELLDPITLKYIKNNILKIVNDTHACNLSIDEDGSFIFYDPNYENNKAKKFTNLGALYDEIKSCLGDAFSFNLMILKPVEIAPGEEPFSKFYQWVKKDEETRTELFQGKGFEISFMRNNDNAKFIWNYLTLFEKTQYFPRFAGYLTYADIDNNSHNLLCENFRGDLIQHYQKGELKFEKKVDQLTQAEYEDDIKYTKYCLNGRVLSRREKYHVINSLVRLNSPQVSEIYHDESTSTDERDYILRVLLHHDYEQVKKDEKMRADFLQGNCFEMTCRVNDNNAQFIWNQLTKSEKIQYFPKFFEFARLDSQKDFYKEFQDELTGLVEKNEINFEKQVNLSKEKAEKGGIKIRKNAVYYLNGHLIRGKEAEPLLESAVKKGDLEAKFLLAEQYFNNGEIKKSLPLYYDLLPNKIFDCLYVVSEICQNKLYKAERMDIMNHLEDSKCFAELTKIYRGESISREEKDYIINSLIKFNSPKSIKTFFEIFYGDSTSMTEKEHIVSVLQESHDAETMLSFTYFMPIYAKSSQAEDFLIYAIACYKLVDRLENEHSEKNLVDIFRGEFLEDIFKNLKKYVEETKNSVSSYPLGLAYCYDKGIGTKQDKSEAIRLYELAAGKGNLKAQWLLADSYRKGLHGEMNICKSLRFFELVAKEGDEKAVIEIKNIFNNSSHYDRLATELVQIVKESNLNSTVFLRDIVNKSIKSHDGNYAVSFFATGAETKYFIKLKKTLASPESGYKEIFSALFESNPPAFLMTVMQEIIKYFFPEAEKIGGMPSSSDLAKYFIEKLGKLSEPLKSASVSPPGYGT
jgi:TPR repeat protein